jgi:Flp pilus assembly protein TadG
MSRRALFARQIPPPASHHKGAAIVELALALPLLLLMFLGMLEFGRVMRAQQTLTNAAREGVRAASIGGMTETEIVQLCETYTNEGYIDSITVSFTPSLDVALQGQPLTVRVETPYTSVSSLPAFWMGGRSLAAEATMRKESEE